MGGYGKGGRVSGGRTGSTEIEGCKWRRNIGSGKNFSHLYGQLSISGVCYHRTKRRTRFLGTGEIRKLQSSSLFVGVAPAVRARPGYSRSGMKIASACDVVFKLGAGGGRRSRLKPNLDFGISRLGDCKRAGDHRAMQGGDREQQEIETRGYHRLYDVL